MTISGGAGWTTDYNTTQESAQVYAGGHAAILTDNASYGINQSQTSGTINTAAASWAP